MLTHKSCTRVRCFRRRYRSGRSARLLIIVLGFGVVLIAFGYWRRQTNRAGSNPQADTSNAPSVLPRQVSYGGYVTSNACRECHPHEHASWHASYHRTMTQAASPQSVVGDFEEVHLQSHGREYHLERRGDEFWATLPDPEWEENSKSSGTTDHEPPLVTRPVVMTTGSHNMQGYWVPGETGNQLWQLPWWYKISEEKWIPRQAGFLEPETERPNQVMWNDRCVYCHAVAGVPGIDVEQGTINTTVAELGIACEACHGFGERHVQRHRNSTDEVSHRASGRDPTIFNPAHSPKQSAQVCGQCHSYYLDRDPHQTLIAGMRFLAGDPLEETRHILSFTGPSANADGTRTPTEKEYLEQGYWSDGACRVGGDEYLGLIESGCYQRGELSCLSCHSMHSSDPNDQLASRLGRNEACLQCHQEFEDRAEQHTHHPADSAGSLCYNCHMPYTSYALLTALRSHRIDSPSVATSVATGRPNACNLCHTDRTLEWTSQQLGTWYGTTGPPALDDDQRNIAASLLWLTRGNALQRALAAWSLGWEEAQDATGQTWQAPFLIESLNDPYPAVRFIAHRSLRTTPGFTNFEYDFVGNAEDRKQEMSRAHSMWRYPMNEIEVKDGVSFLFDVDGNMRRDILDRLKQQRDDSPIRLPE